MEEIEEGLLPINYDQAEKLCEYLGTNVSQVLFDNELYDDEVPEQYHDDVREWERVQKEADDEAMRDFTTTLSFSAKETLMGISKNPLSKQQKK